MSTDFMFLFAADWDFDMRFNLWVLQIVSNIYHVDTSLLLWVDETEEWERAFSVFVVV